MGRKWPKKASIIYGGVSSNFPIWIFDRGDGAPRRPTFGFLLDEQKGRARPSFRYVSDVIDLVLGLVLTGIGAMDKRLGEHDKYRTARLRTCGVSAMDFGLSENRQAELFEAGYQDALEFLRGFSWVEYKSKFRGQSK